MAIRLPPQAGLPDVYEYLDYHPYFRDVLAACRKRTPGFSLRAFARLCGSSSPNFFQLVMRGTIHPNPLHLRSFARSAGLDRQRRAYLGSLAALARARTPRERERLARKVLNTGARAPHRVVSRDQYDYYACWYYSVLRALIGYRKIPVAGADLGAVGRELRPAVRPKQVRRALGALARLGLIKVGPDGCYAQADAVITTGDDVKSVQVMAFQRETMKLGLQALERVPAAQRDISTLTLNISQRGFGQIRERIRGFRKEIMAIAAADMADDRVYQCNMQLIPVTRPGGGGR